jgi:cytochrome c oxidase cbb3-type subunit I/II
MATFEGPLLSIRAVNYLSHYTDWTIGHVHGGTLGWNGFMAAAMFYYLVPRLWKTKLYSEAMANMHFWIGTFGILLYVASMWASGITQGLMLNGTVENGTVLAYPNFLDTLNSIRPLMLTRAVGGTLYLIGWVMLIYNVARTIIGKEVVNGTITVDVEEEEETRALEGSIGLAGTFFNWPMFYSFTVILGMCLWFFGDGLVLLTGIIMTILFCLIAIVHFQATSAKWSDWYEKLLGNWAPFSILVFIAVAIGGMIQIVPTVMVQTADNIEDRIQVPYTPLELAGRDIYISEGCYNCHSQMIRMMKPDVLRYGDYSRLGESIYDHPFQWGSKRTGPDLAREGGKRPNVWHYDHMRKPTDISPGSNMPPYPWLLEKDVDWSRIPGKIRAMRTLGVPYPDWTDEEILANVEAQANEIVADLESNFRSTAPEREIVALIAYLQKLGVSEDAASAAARRDSAR